MAKSKTTTGSVVTLIILVGVAIALLSWNWAYQRHVDRTNINDAIADGLRERVKAVIAAQRSSQKPIPGRKDHFPPNSIFVKAIKFDYDTSTIFISLNNTRFYNSDIQPDAWISFTAVVQNDAITGWKCDKHGVPAKLLPAECR